MARYYANRNGRFLTPDPGHVGADPSNPQSWNAYIYISNDPINFLDPLGLCRVRSDGTLEEDGGTPCGPMTYMIVTDLGMGRLIFDFAEIPNGCFDLIVDGLSFGNVCFGITGDSPTDKSFGEYLQIDPNPPQKPPKDGPTIAPPPRDWQPPQPWKPAPTGVEKYMTKYVPCALGEFYNESLGNDERAATTVAVHIAPLAPNNLRKGGPLVYLALEAVYDLSIGFRVRATCSRSVYGPR